MRRFLETTLKILVLLVLLFGIYRLWRAVPSLTAAAPDDDDITVQPRVTVHVAAVTRATLHGYRLLDAVIEPQPARGLQTAAESLVSSPVVGIAAEVFCREGQHVEAGQPLLMLDDRDSQVAISKARALLAAATAAQSATSEAVKAGNVPPRDLLRADLARTVAETDLSAATARQSLFTVSSPIAGTVVRLNTVAGQSVGPTVVSVDVVDTDRLTAAAAAPPWVLKSLSPGMPVELQITSSAATSRPASPAATVTFLDPSVDPSTGLGQVDVNLPAGSGFVPGESVHLRITTAEHADVLTVPIESVAVDAQGRPSISGIERDFRWAVRHSVTVGLRDGGRMEISGPGIREGLDVVTTGAQALPDETRIEVVR